MGHVGECSHSMFIFRCLGLQSDLSALMGEEGLSNVLKGEQGLSISMEGSHLVGPRFAEPSLTKGSRLCWHMLDLELGSFAVHFDLDSGGFRGRSLLGDRGIGFIDVPRSVVGFMISSSLLGLGFGSQPTLVEYKVLSTVT